MKYNLIVVLLHFCYIIFGDDMFRKYINLTIFFIICIVPLIITPWRIDYYYYPKLITLYILTAVIFILFILSYKNMSFKTTPVYMVLFSFLFMVIISTITSISTSRSIIGRKYRYDGLLTTICYIILFFVSSKFYNFSKSHVKAVIISSTLISIYGILQYFGADPIPVDSIRVSWQRYVYSTIGNPNFLSSYLILFLPVNVSYFIYTGSIPGLISSSILFSTLILTKTRSGWVGFIFSFFLLVYFMAKKHNKYILKNTIVSFLLFSIIALSINTLSDNYFSHRFQSIFKDTKTVINHEKLYEYAGSSRIFIWKRVIKLIEKSPMIGYGPDTLDIVFMTEYKNEIPRFFRALTVDKAHNEFLQIAFNSGIPTLVLYALFIFMLSSNSFKNYNKNILIPPLICSVSGYLVQSFFNISVVSIAPAYWVMLGILYGLSCDVYIKT